MTGRGVTHLIGATFLLITIGSACLSVIGIGMVSAGHAPAWASLFFYCVLGVDISLSGTIGYLFYIPKRK
jgi:hypothetical protein